MARYRVTLEAEFVDQKDAIHWSHWVAGFESIARPIDVISVVRIVSLPKTEPEQSSNE